MSQSSQDESNGIRLETWIAGVGALQREMLEFVAHRLAKDSEAIRGAISCDSLGDALAIQQRWVSETVSDYLAESSKVASLVTQQGSAFPQFGAAGEAEADAPAGRAKEAEVEVAKAKPTAS